MHRKLKLAAVALAGLCAAAATAGWATTPGPAEIQVRAYYLGLREQGLRDLDSAVANARRDRTHVPTEVAHSHRALQQLADEEATAVKSARLIDHSVREAEWNDRKATWFVDLR